MDLWCSSSILRSKVNKDEKLGTLNKSNLIEVKYTEKWYEKMYKNQVSQNHIQKKNQELNAQENQNSRQLSFLSTINNSVHIIHVIFSCVCVCLISIQSPALPQKI